MNNLILRACQKLGRLGEKELTTADMKRKRYVRVVKGERGEKLYHSRKNSGFRI